MMAWDYASRLYNAEFNVRWNACDRLTLLAGFRWANLSEELQGTLPSSREEIGDLSGIPTWETIFMVSKSAPMESYSSVVAFP